MSEKNSLGVIHQFIISAFCLFHCGGVDTMLTWSLFMGTVVI